MTRRTLVVDTDPGQDDALALLLAFAHPEAFELRLVTTVAGTIATGINYSAFLAKKQ